MDDAAGGEGCGEDQGAADGGEVEESGKWTAGKGGNADGQTGTKRSAGLLSASASQEKKKTK
eukprot:500147-Hanusia_phi.AAC.1